MLYSKATLAVAHNPVNSIHGGGLMNRKYLAAFVAVLAIFAIHVSGAFAATGTLHAFFPGGLPAYNAKAACSTLMSRASIDITMGGIIAQQSNASSFNANQYSCVGYSNGAPDSANSGVNNAGGLTPTADDANCNSHSRMLVIKNTKTGMLVYFCVKCGNIRLHVRQPVRSHPFALGTVLKLSQTFKRNYNYTCQPSGQKVYITVTTWVHGLVKAATWGKVWGKAKLRINASIKVKFNQTVKFRCGGIPQTPVIFTKKWQDASGADITGSMAGEAVPIVYAVYDNVGGTWKQYGPSYHTHVNPGTDMTDYVPSVKKGEMIYACVDSAYEDSKNAVPYDSKGNQLTKGCESVVVVKPAAAVKFIFIDRNKPAPTPPPTTPSPTTPKCQNDCTPTPPPTCQSNCTPTTPKSTPALPAPPPTPNDPNPTGGATDPGGQGTGDTTGSTPEGTVNPDGGQASGTEAPDPQ